MIRRRRKSKRAIKVAKIIIFLFLGVSFIFMPYIDDILTDEGPQKLAPQPAPAKEAAASTATEYLALINKACGLRKDYEPQDLQRVESATGADNGKHQKLRKTAALAFNDLTAAAAGQGHTIKLTSGYRSYAYQKELYERYYGQDGKIAEQYSAKAGYSEHQSGLSADVSSPSAGYMLTQAYGEAKEGKWLADNAHKYGFIIRYPKGKEDITGYQYEPWHIRYVGGSAAAEIYQKGIVLEEYLGSGA